MTLDHGGGEQSVYKHVVPTVAAGTVVYGGQQIAKLFAARAYPEHLHFEIWKNGSHTNPNGSIAAAQKIPSPLTAAKAKEQSEKSSGKGSVATAPGTTTSPDKSQKPASPPPPSPEMTKNFQMAWDNRNNGLARGRIEGSWNDMSVEQQQQAKVWAKSTGKDWTEMRLKEKLQLFSLPLNGCSYSIKTTVRSRTNTTISNIQSTTILNNNCSHINVSWRRGQQRPQVISVGGGGGGGQTIMLPGPSGGQVLNSLLKTMLLTNLSGT